MSTETLHDRRDDIPGFEIAVSHGPGGDRFKVRIDETVRGIPIASGLHDYASGGAANFKDALRQALHYVSPALAGEVFPDYYDLRRRCKFSSTCEHAHPGDIANHKDGETW